jgi:hypothetical protein
MALDRCSALTAKAAQQMTMTRAKLRQPSPTTNSLRLKLFIAIPPDHMMFEGLNNAAGPTRSTHIFSILPLFLLSIQKKKRSAQIAYFFLASHR